MNTSTGSKLFHAAVRAWWLLDALDPVRNLPILRRRNRLSSWAIARWGWEEWTTAFQGRRTEF